MNINFFEEYPTDENMAKLHLVDWPSTVLVAAPSFKEFDRIEKKYGQKYPHVTFGWWPTIPGSYWISGFSRPSDLTRLFSELKSIKAQRAIPILLDLELPRNKIYYLKNLFNIRKNKKSIERFLAEAPMHNLKIYTAEHAAMNGFVHRLLRMVGISPPFSLPHTKLPMCYTSMGEKYLGKILWRSVKKYIGYFARSHTERVGLGIGTIATGVFGNEPILSPETLVNDLQWAKENKTSDIFIFRLGGMNQSYTEAIAELGAY